MKTNTYFRKNDEEDFPESLLQILMEGSLLYHVPYYYLLPGEMIKENELRFFQLDHNWVLAYLDGICSPGRNAAIDYQHDTDLLVEHYRQALEGQESVRRKLRKQSAKDTIQSVEKCSGFLLKSELVVDYRGLEFKGFDNYEGIHPLSILRIEKLGPDIIIALFHGNLKRLDIGQPPESIHFGFHQDEQGNLTKRLRDVEKGELYKDERFIDVVIKDPKLRVLDIEKTSKNIENGLGIEINSAIFALEMIQNAHTGVFTLEGKDDDNE